MTCSAIRSMSSAMKSNIVTVLQIYVQYWLSQITQDCKLWSFNQLPICSQRFPFPLDPTFVWLFVSTNKSSVSIWIIFVLFFNITFLRKRTLSKEGQQAARLHSSYKSTIICLILTCNSIVQMVQSYYHITWGWNL